MQTIRGAQHEVAFAQIPSNTNRQFRPSTLAEDLQGVDFVVIAGTRTMYIDVKASLSQVEASGVQNGAFACKPGGKVIMYSLVRDTELNGGFLLPSEVVATKAAALEQLLAQAGQELSVR